MPTETDRREISRETRALLRDAGFPTSNGEVVVPLDGSRTQRVQIFDCDDSTLRIETVVAKARRLERVDSPFLAAWQRNRAVRLVGFRVDHRGWLLGHAWIPRAGLTAEELAIYVRAVALESDRLEFLLTGLDVE